MAIASSLQKTWGNLQQADGPLKGKVWPACYIQVYLWNLKTFIQKALCWADYKDKIQSLSSS